MPKAIFFDVDDTLLNFGLSSKGALADVFDRFGLNLDDAVQNRYDDINNGLWAEQKRGLRSVQNVIDSRFRMLFDAMEWQVDVEAFRDAYQHNLAQSHVMEQGALETVQQLSEKYQLYVASNSILAMQTSRLRLAKLLPYFQDLFVSNDIGYEKPDLRFFETCLQRSQLQPEDIVFVGDSLEADMAGASGSGMTACWYNPQQKDAPQNIAIQYTITHLSQLTELY